MNGKLDDNDGVRDNQASISGSLNEPNASDAKIAKNEPAGPFGAVYGFISHAKGFLAALGGILGVAALFEPWTTEEYFDFRLKIILVLLAGALIYQLAHSKWPRKLRYSIGIAAGIFVAGYVSLTPTFPLKLYSYYPSAKDFEFTRYTPGMAPVIAYKAGIVHYIKREFGLAEEAFKAALKSRRVRPYALNRLANTQRVLDKNLEALKSYELAIQSAESAELREERVRLLENSWHDRGWVLRRLAQPLFAIPDKKQEWQELQRKALASFVNASEVNPRFRKAWYNAAQVNFDREEWHEARRRYLRAISIDTQYGRAAYNLAIVEIKLGNPDEAVAWLKRAFQIDASWLHKAKNDSDFDEIREQPLYNKLVRDAKLRLGKK